MRSVCWNALFTIPISYPSFCLPSWKRLDLAGGYVNRMYKFAISTATEDSRRTSLKTLLVGLAKVKKEPREALPVCKAFFFSKNSFARKVGWPLQKRRQNLTWTYFTRYSAERISQDICKIFGWWISSGFLSFILRHGTPIVEILFW